MNCIKDFLEKMKVGFHFHDGFSEHPIAVKNQRGEHQRPQAQLHTVRQRIIHAQGKRQEQQDKNF